MKVKSVKLTVLSAVLAASACFSIVAHADDVAWGKVWGNSTSYTSPYTLSSTAPAGTPDATFTVSHSGGNDLSFYSSSDNGISNFLTSGGDTLTYLTGSGEANNSINNAVFEFTGTTYLVSGQTYTITKDDAAFLSLNGGGNVLGAGSLTDTAPSDVTFSVGTTGYYSFDLLYQEVNGPPAELSGNIGTITSTPEPGSIFLLGTGLLALAGLVRRTITA